ncbi:MAG: tetratricopeptide repeat protein, partial [Myxococcota bacterium]|nr:tetratricopeptide repeat protein [Myxococcota bacterium]
MNRLPTAVRRAVEDAVRIVDGGVQYGALGIDAPPEVGARAAEILQAAVDQAPDDADLRCLYAAALSLAGRITESREQLGVATEKRRDHFEAVAELDHRSAWRHVFLSPPWSEGAGAPAPLAHGWIDADGGLALVSFRDGAERVISLLGRAPATVARHPGRRDLPVALDYSWRTRTAGPFMAFHVGVGGPEPDDMEVVNGFAFPWPEGEGHRHELLIGAFLRQDRTFVVLVDAAGRAVVNRLVRFGARDMDRNRLYLTRLATARVRSIDPRDRIATIARYREELPPDAIRGRLAHRMRVGEAPRDADDADLRGASAPTPAMHAPAATEADAETRPAAASPGADGAA